MNRRQNKKRLSKLSKSIDILCKHLENDESYFYSWQANIAMKMFDAINGNIKIDIKKLNIMCNNGAKNFLNTLVYINK